MAIAAQFDMGARSDVKFEVDQYRKWAHRGGSSEHVEMPQRQIALQERTFKRLVAMAERLSKATGRSIGPLQVGTVLLEHAAYEVGEADIAKMLAAG